MAQNIKIERFGDSRKKRKRSPFRSCFGRPERLRAASIGHGGNGERWDFPDFSHRPTKRQTSVYPARPAALAPEMLMKARGRITFFHAACNRSAGHPNAR